jgi:hypothetical protein
MCIETQIVPGIVVDSKGQATVDAALAEVLFDLAIQLEEPTELPVDVQHVVAAVILAAREGVLGPNTPLASDDPALLDVLVGYVKKVFSIYDGKVGQDD